MASKKPAILVRLQQEDYDLIKRVAEFSGTSMGSVLREYAEMSRPMLLHMVSLGEALQKVDEDRRESHQEAMAGAVLKGQALYEQLTGQQALFYDWLESIGESIEGDSVKGAEVGKRPPSNNMGVRSEDLGAGRFKTGVKRDGDGKGGQVLQRREKRGVKA